MVNTLEIIEYKSKGHPDTLTDLIVEDCTWVLEQYYIKRYGRILHYNVDKAMFLAGEAKIYYGGGRILKHPCFILGGQASKITDQELLVLLKRSIKKTSAMVLPNLKNFKIEIRTSNVSESLKNICENTQFCNDTSFGVGYYPYSSNELQVFSIRDRLDSMIKEGKIPIGEVYKIMYTPENICISAPLYAQRVRNDEEYRNYKKEIERQLREYGKVIFNPDFDSGNPYLTLTGSSIECGDDGAVGRGNRYNGLITPCRPMTMEAYCGKNNSNHIGKIYQKWAFEKAKEIYVKTGKYTEVIIIGQIGKPIKDYEIYINGEVNNDNRKET